jgi:hypothetical protein
MSSANNAGNEKYWKGELEFGVNSYFKENNC